MEKFKILALFGESASGKDTIQKWLVNTETGIPVHGIVSCTTRPRRDYEQEGIDYYFLTNEQFAEKVLNGDMLEATNFNNWFYGTPIDALDKTKINIGVFNPAGINALIADSRLEVIPLYVQASDKTRLLRSLNREENPNCAEICRRYFADKKDFYDFDFEYAIINNEIAFDKKSLIMFLQDFSHFYKELNGQTLLESLAKKIN